MCQIKRFEFHRNLAVPKINSTFKILLEINRSEEYRTTIVCDVLYVLKNCPIMKPRYCQNNLVLYMHQITTSIMTFLAKAVKTISSFKILLQKNFEKSRIATKYYWMLQKQSFFYFMRTSGFSELYMRIQMTNNFLNIIQGDNISFQRDF